MSRKPRKSKGTWTRENEPILGGKGFIYRVNASGDVWQFRMWIPEEGKHLRKSLRTRDFDAAKERAEKLIFETYSDVATGKKIFGVTLQELVDAFLVWREKDVVTGDITKERLGTIKSQTNRLLEYKDGNLKVSELDKNSLFDWAQWRRTEYDAKKVTIRNEQATINQMIDFGYREGYCHFPRFDFRKISITQDEIGKRDVFSLQEYDNLVRYMRVYTSKKECPDTNLRKERLIVRDAVLIASNTMVRVGELWGLEWRDIVSIDKTVDENGLYISLVTLNIRAEISKNRKNRRVVARGGEYFERLRKNSTHTQPNDYLFCAVGGTQQLERRKWYLHWKNLMQGIGVENYQDRQLTWYSLRHFGITCRIRAKVPYLDIATVAGTSATHIENHYGHYDDDMLKSTALKNFTVTTSGLVFKDK